MATVTPLINGEAGIASRTKINANDAAINAELGALANKTKSATTGILTAGVNIITFSTPFTDAVYQLIPSVFDAVGNPSAFIFNGTQTASGFTINLFFDSKVTYIAHKI